MNKAAAFIMDNFIPVSLLKEKDGGKTEIVRDDGNRFFVRKIIPFTGLPYKNWLRCAIRACRRFFTARKTAAAPIS